MVTYATNAAALDRYASGFPIRYCPVCEEGHLEIEEKTARWLWIPFVRRTVRCDNCRSVLREVGKRRWRYAVDRSVNEDFYRNLNNRILTEAQLLAIAPDYAADAPLYIDEN